MKWNNDLNELSYRLNIPITYYEDMFDINSEARLRKGNRNKFDKKLI
jgi:hypothetical protein